MAKTKKTTQDREQNLPINDPQPVATTSAIGYSGQLSIKVKLGNKILNVNKGHNSGEASLFEYLAKCLAGNYDNSLRPKYIRLFAKSDTEKVDDPQFNENTVISILLPYTDATKVESSQSVNYHFVIPSTAITKLNGTIFKAALYCENNQNTYNQLSASYLITNVTGDNWGDGIDLNEFSNKQFSLLVDWTLSITNLN